MGCVHVTSSRSFWVNLTKDFAIVCNANFIQHNENFFWIQVDYSECSVKSITKSHVCILGTIVCNYGNSNKTFWSGYGTQCCGAMGVFDENIAKCCSGQRLVQKHSFCGSVEYDQCSQICCDGNIHPKIEGITSCCGKKSYNTATQICCNQIPEQKYKCVEKGYSWWKYHIKYEAGCGYYGVFYTRKYNEKCPGRFKKMHSY